MAIYLKLDKKPATLNELIIKFFSYYNGSLKSVATYSDEKCEVLQCPQNKYRSIDEFLEVAQTYFPDLPTKEILNELILTVIEYKGGYYYIYGSNCSTINKSVICFCSDESFIKSNNIIIKAFNSYTHSCKISWLSLCDMLETTKDGINALVKENYFKVIEGKNEKAIN